MTDKLYHQYINEIQQYKQITIEEEKELANNIKAKYDFTGEVPLEVEEKANKALDKLVTSNLKLVVKIANGITKNEKDRMDLIAEGNRGLMRAAETFDPDKGAKFSVYSSFWIKQFISKFIYKNSTIFKLPDKVWSNKYKIAYFVDDYETRYGVKPSIKKISQSLEITEVAVINILDINRKVVNLDTSSLDDNDSSCNEEIISLDNGKVPDNHCMSNESFELVQEIVSTLPDRERDIIIRRYGLNGQKPETLQVIGKDHNLTQERIRQLENLVIKQLKAILAGKMVDINPIGTNLVYG